MNHVLNKSTKIVTVLLCLLLGFTQMTFAQSEQVRGKVTDDAGEAVIGASVIQKGTTIGTSTDINGNFTLNVSGNATLTISYLGYVSKEVRVNNQSFLNIQLSEDIQMLDEVVVTGYGTQKKATLTGSISTVNNRELTVTKNENVVNMLAGKMPGLRITQRTAQPGQYNTVLDVRGFGGEPLFVIDGVAREKDYFARMDAEEIESIVLLKDASAAIYGIRAANGVMLVTTKKGTAQNGKVDITYTGNFTMQEMLFIPDGYSILEWKTLRNEQHLRDFNRVYFDGVETRGRLHTLDELKSAPNEPFYDWQREVFSKLTPQTQHNMNLNGGTESLRYFVSFGYLKQDGAYASRSLWADKYNLRSNVDAKITRDLSMRVSLNGIIGSTHEPSGTTWDNYKAAFLAIPGTPFYANDNPEYLNGYTPWNNEFTNLIGKMDSKYVGYKIRNERRLNGSFELGYDIPVVKGLKARMFYDYALDMPDNTNYSKTYQTYKWDTDKQTYNAQKLENGPNTTISRSQNLTTSTDMQLGLSYNNRFGQHTVDGTFVYEEIYSEWDNFAASRILKLNSEYLFAGEADGQTGSGGSPGDRSQRAFIGKFNYDYAGKYMLGLVGRYEANSRWPKESRWGLFPSVMAAWRVSEEGFIKNNLDFLSNLKLRASYGKLGDESNANQYPDVFVGFETHNNFGWIFGPGSASKGIRATAIPNMQKTWINVTMQNAAVDFGLFGDKLSGSFEVYRRDRKGLMGDNSAVIPGTIGANLPQVNLNNDRSEGWELELMHRNRINGINYYVSGQISNTRRIQTYKEETPASNSYDYWRNRYNGRYLENDMWWARKMGGMFTSIDEIRNYQNYPVGQGTLPGDWWTVDWNGDGIIDDGDVHPLATKGLPYFNYGISLGASYKDFDLSINFQGAYKVYMQLSEVFTEALPFGGQNSLNWYVDRWHPNDPFVDYWNPNTQWISGYYPLTGGDGRRTQSNGIMDASYLRMKTLEIGYTLPKSILAKARIKNLRIHLNGFNLLTFSALNRAIDPERSSATRYAGGSAGGADAMYMYPNNKTYTIGASFKF